MLASVCTYSVAPSLGAPAPLMDVCVAALPTAQLLAADAATLLPGQWANDGALSFYAAYLAHARYPAARCAVLNPGVATLCQLLPPGDLGEALQRTGLGPACPALVLPLSDASDLRAAAAGTHWTLLQWTRAGGFAHLDSASGQGSGSGSGSGAGATPSAAPSASLAVARAVAASLAPLLGAPPPAQPLHSSACAQQTNCFDCGMHVAAAMEALLAGLAGAPLAAPPPAAAMRARILAAAWQCRPPGAAAEAFWAAFHAAHGAPEAGAA
jgi:hypothetical protein